MISSTLGKIEMETMEDGREGKVHDDLVKRAVLNVFDRYFSAADFESIVAAFEEGSTVDTGAEMAASRYVDEAGKFTGFNATLKRLEIAKGAPELASGLEFVLEGLHLNRRLNRDLIDGGFRYRV